MKKIIRLMFLNLSYLFSNEYKYNCPIPDIIMQTIKLTENNFVYPFLIRNNDKNNLDKFNKIINKYTHSFPDNKDEFLIDCKSDDNCVLIALDLIKNGITNLDLGLFQINYKSFKYKNLFSYFDEELAYINACNAVLTKIKITKKWNWETVAAYHSLTPNLNKIYKQKLLKNFNKINNKEVDTNLTFSIEKYKKYSKKTKDFFQLSYEEKFFDSIEWN